MTAEPGPAGPDGPRWLADAMLGRLARYLRFLGHDTAYVRGLDDRRIRVLSVEEHRTLLTRDRILARQATGAFLIRGVEIRGQLRELFGAFPHLPRRVTFDRCPECNQRLRPWTTR